MTEQKSWTMDDSARAGNPGGIKIQPMRWYSNYPLWPTIWLSGVVFSFALALLLHWSFWILFAIAVLLKWFYWQKTREHFLHGNVTPSVIVSMEPMLYATLTDLTHGYGEHRAIKVIQKRFTSIMGKTPKVGSFFPSVSVYEQSMDEKKPHWETFFQFQLSSPTNDPSAN